MPDQNLDGLLKEKIEKTDYSLQNMALYRKISERLNKIVSYLNTIEGYGLENIDFIRDKPAIIAPNHVGSSKDVIPLAQVFLEKDIQLFYGARSEMFDKDKLYPLIKKHLKKHLKEFSPLIRDSQIRRFADFAESNLSKIGAIPLDVNGGSNREALRIMEQYLGEYKRKVVLFQFEKEPKKDLKSYLFHGAKPGAAILASRVYNNYGIDVPVVPVGIYGSRGLIPLDYIVTHLARKPIKIRVGQPLYITSFLEQGNPVQSMTAALGDSIWRLLRETLKENG
jgi:1-acyl-sn-glycerol-3-phosphate acyltransferase